jgi:hypothetical protein
MKEVTVGAVAYHSRVLTVWEALTSNSYHTKIWATVATRRGT